MLTKNFYNYVMAHLTNRTIANGYVFPDGTTVDAKRVNSASTYMWDKMGSIQIGGIPTVFSGVGARIGTGITPATADDCTLESVITSGLTVQSASSVTVTRENDFVAAYAIYTLSNNGTTAVSISEIGLFCTPDGSGTTKPILMDRTVLEKPIVINPGEAKPITYTIRFNYPVE